MSINIPQQVGSLIHIVENMEDGKGVVSSPNINVEFLGEELAARLCEPKTE